MLQANPSTTNGVIQITENLHNHVQTSGDGKVFLILCSVDGLNSVERMHTKRARANGETKLDKLKGLIEMPQEFHKEVIMLQLLCLIPIITC